ncbi:MAG: D-alanyl-D-alanine carboxypeptidase/D-alanyl-D-alanine-endopeptidase [Tannerella sp.]|nr:D-alanyl-D-alanine carboxypeptidase/D-alanyl-D-alanine-endopeptidase [Tannerella sp.]
MKRKVRRAYPFLLRLWVTLCLSAGVIPTDAQSPLPLKRFLEKSNLKGASVSFMVKETASGNVLYGFDTEREVIPASVMKTVTTASALAILGENFRFETSVLYDGEIRDGVLHGDLYICGTGDPTLNSAELSTPKDSILALWTLAVKKAGIRQIAGSVIGDESIFDTEGVSMKWMREDLGNYYGQGSYGLNLFDNQYTLYVDTDTSGAVPTLSGCDPPMPLLTFRNYLTTLPVTTDSCYITGFPFSNERYLYGVVPTHRSRLRLKGDIPDPSLYLAQYFHHYLAGQGIDIRKEPSCYRILSESGRWRAEERRKLTVTYSPTLKEIVRITHLTSQNLYADALLKAIGLHEPSDRREAVSSFEKGVRVIKNYWNRKGLNTSPLWMYDGSGLSAANKVSARFLCDFFVAVSAHREISETFIRSLPQAGMEGTVRTLFKGTALQGKARLKSGTMSRVRCYGGYVTKDGKQYAVVILINNFSGKSALVRAQIEELFLSLF